MEVACEDGVPRRPCGVTASISTSKLHAISTLSDLRGGLTDEHCITAVKRLGGLNMRERGVRRVESDLRKAFEMDKHMQATDRVMSTIAKLEAFLDENMIRDSFKPDGQWQESFGRLVSNLRVRGMQPASFCETKSFCERIPVQFRFEGKDDTDADEVQAIIFVIVQKLEA